MHLFFYLEFHITYDILFLYYNSEESSMDYNTLLELTADLGYRLAMNGAETFRIEESVRRILSAYGIESEVFAIPNCLTVSIETHDGKPMTRMRRIGFHGNDLDTVEKYSNLSRRICAEKPEPVVARQWLKDTDISIRSYSLPVLLLGNFLGALGFAIVFGGSFIDGVCSGISGVLIGIINHYLGKLKVNPFFTTIAAAFIMTFASYSMGAFNIANNTDTVIIGALMILVPGLIFTNAMRDIIYGDTNSGMNRIVQVILVAAAIALGTGSGWRFADLLFDFPANASLIVHLYEVQNIATFIACAGFAIIVNILGFGIAICAFGGMITWVVYCIANYFGLDLYASYFLAAVTSAIYSEIMARVRKYPAISYLVVGIFPLIPGAGIYYATSHLLQGSKDAFVQKALETIGIAGIIAVGILMVSTFVRLQSTIKKKA